MKKGVVGPGKAFELTDDLCFPHSKQEYKDFEEFDKALQNAQTTDKETLSKNLNLAAKIAAGFESSSGRRHAAWRLDLISKDRMTQQESAVYAIDTIMRHADKIANVEVVAAYERLFSKMIVSLLRRALRRRGTSVFLGERFMKILHSWKRRNWFLPVLGQAVETILKLAPSVQRPSALDPATLRKLAEPARRKKEEAEEDESDEEDEEWERQVLDREMLRRQELLESTKGQRQMGNPEVLRQVPHTPNIGGLAPRTPAFGAMPMTPALGQQQRLPVGGIGRIIPQTPANFGSSGPIPQTPANLGGAAVPRTPANLGGTAVPQTPANLGGQSVPMTPANLGGQSVPQTPANLRQGGGAVPQTPMGLRFSGAPQTPMRIPGTPSKLLGNMAPGTPATAAPPTPKRLGATGTAGLGTPGTVPATPMGLQAGVPGTPRAPGGVPATPRRLGTPVTAVPMTPGVGAPGTPGRNMAPGTPGRNPVGPGPQTPGLAPQTPGLAPGSQGMPTTPAGLQKAVPTTPGVSKEAPKTPVGPPPATPVNFSARPLPVGAETPAMPAQPEEPDAKKQRREGQGLWTQAEAEAPTVLPPGVAQEQQQQQQQQPQQ